MITFQNDINITSNQKILYVYNKLMKHIYYHHHKMQNKQYNQHHQNLTNIIEKLVDKIRDNELMMINIHDDVNKLLISNDKLTKKVEYVYSNTKTTVESVLTSIDDIQVSLSSSSSSSSRSSSSSSSFL